MTQDNIVKFAEPGAFEDPLTEVLRSGARKLLAQAIEAEVSDFIDRHSGFLTDEGQQRLVRHGHLPEREIMTGIGPVGVCATRVRRVGQGEARIRSKSLEVLIPILYLKGISMIFKLAQAAEKHWRRLDGQNQLPKVILGITFNDGIEVAKEEAQTAA